MTELFSVDMPNGDKHYLTAEIYAAATARLPKRTAHPTPRIVRRSPDAKKG